MEENELFRALRQIKITTSRMANDQLAGNYSSVVKGQGLSFHEVRPYHMGDDVRKIDWNVTARMQEPYIKVFVEEREMTVMVLADVSASAGFGTVRVPKTQLAAEVTALCAFSAVRSNDRIGLILMTDEVEKIVPPKRGDKHGMRVVREVLGFKPKRRGTDLRAGLHALHRVAKRRSVAFVVSDFFAEEYERALALASHKHDCIPVVLWDKRDRELPDVGLATFEDFETGESVVVDTGSKKVREFFAQQVAKREFERDQIFTRLGLDVVRIETSQSPVEPLRALFARRAKRGGRR